MTNTGNVTLTSVGVDDPKVGSVSCPDTTLVPGASTTCTATYTLTQADVDAGQVANTATVSGTPPTGDPVTGTDSVTTPIDQAPSIALDKTAGAPSGATAGSTIDYTFIVTNTGNVTLTSVGVDDPKVGSVSCPDTTLVPGASTTCTATYTLTQADVDAGQVVNTATAGGTPPTGDPVTGTDSVTTPIEQTPSISLTKSADVTSELMAGDLVNYTFLLTNTGNVSLDTIEVSDPMLEAVTCPVTTLAPGESTTCTAPAYTVTMEDANRGQIVNTATATASFCGDGGCVVVDSTSSVVVTTLPAVIEGDTDDDGDGGSGGGALAFTGFEGGPAAGLGVGILTAGVLLLVVGRRRRKA